MKNNRTALLRRRLWIGSVDYICNALVGLCGILMIIGALSGDRDAVIWLLIALFLILMQAICTALLEYRKALTGKTLIGGKIADSMHIWRQFLKQRRFQKIHS